MAYTSYDFTETLERLTEEHPFQSSHVKACIAAWGEKGDVAEWKGGFVVLLNNGRLGVITGWCDETGWGCRDGIEVFAVDFMPQDINLFLKGREDA